MKHCLFILLSIAFLLPSHISALEKKDKTHKMDEVVVTSTQKAKAVDMPSSISIITGEELEEMGANNIVEALGKIPGVVDSSTKGRDVVIRGNKSAMAGGPVILIDGVPQKMGDYRYSEFNFIPVTQIEKIEVLKSSGIAYSPGSARGVINIITKKSNEAGIHGNVSASYGSWNSNDKNVSIHGIKDKIDFQLNAGHYHTDGYEQEKENRLSLLGKLGYRLSDQSRIGLSINHMDYENNTADGLSKGQWQLDNYRREIHFPNSETDPTLIWHNENDQKNTTTALEYTHKDDKKFLNSSVSWSKYSEEFRRNKDLYTDPEAVYHESSDQDTYTFTLSGGYYLDFRSVSYTPTFGFNYEDIENTVFRVTPNDPSINTDKYNFDLKEKVYGISWNNDFYFGEKWELNAGARMDWVELYLKDKVPTTVDQERDMFSYFIAPAYHFTEKATIYTSVGRNYWFPTPRYYAWAVEKGGTLNPVENLEPEEVITYELGYKHIFSRAFNVNATLYFSEYNEKFGSVYEGSTSRGQGNIGDAEAKGIEFEADGSITDLFGYRFAAAYQKIEWTSGSATSYLHPDNTYVRNANLSGKQIYWVPELSGTIGLDFYPIEHLKFSVDMNYMGERYVDYLNRIEYPDKTTFDARVSYNLKQYKFWVLGKNIFDEDLEYVSNSTGKLTNAGGMPANKYYIQDGIYLEAGISYNF